MHTNKCTLFKESVDLFIKVRSAQFLTREELVWLLNQNNPCHECAPLTTSLSPMTGRLYKIVWDEYKKGIHTPMSAKVKDMFHE